MMSLQNVNVSKAVKAYICYQIIDQNSFNYELVVFKVFKCQFDETMINVRQFFSNFSRKLLFLQPLISN
jgi:hypothetical protein